MSTNVSLPLNDYGYAYVNGSTGVAFEKSPNITVSRSGTGVYPIALAQPLVPQAFVTVTVTKSGSAGADESYSIDLSPVGDTTNTQMIVSTFAGSSAADLNFQIIVWIPGTNARQANP